MNKCPKCNNTISNIDVLCPKCGALVEQINVSSLPKNIVTEENKESSAKSEPTSPNHYENLVVYNESYQTTGPPVEPVNPDIEEPTIEDDFEIDNIIASANSAPRVNPLFAHIEKNRLDEEAAEQAAQQKSETGDAAASSDPSPVETKADDADVQDTQETPAAADLEQVKEPVEEDAPLAEDIELEEDTAVQETPQKEEASIDPPPVVSDTDAPAKEENEEADQSDDEKLGSLDAMPAYSQAYLDALRNIELTEDELEIEENFDPDAFMEKFKKDAETNVDIESSPMVDVAGTVDLLHNSNNQPTNANSQEVQKKPLKRRYNPNRVKPVEEPEIEVPEVVAAVPKEEINEIPDNTVIPTEPEVAPKKASKTKAAKSKEEPGEDTFHKQSKAKVPDDELLELTLEPDKFYESAASENEDKKDEVFVFGQELNNPVDEHKSSGSMNPYSAAVARPSTDVPKSASTATASIPFKSGKLKRLPFWAAILIWLAVTAGIFFGTYMFNNYVTSNYSGYGEYLSEITDGKIDLDSLIN